MPFIYKITSPTGKVYIGSTVKKNVEHRWIAYKSLKCKQQRRVYHSLKKHGVESHAFEVIAECSLEDVLRLECMYGEKYDVLGENGLNLALPMPTDTYASMRDETKEKIRKTVKKQFESKERREELSRIKKQWFIDNKERAKEISDKRKITKNTIENREHNRQKRLDFIKNNPEKWDEMNRKKTEKMRSDEHRKLRKELMKEWVKNNPEKHREMIDKSIASRRTPQGIENNRAAQKRLYENGYKNPCCKKVICTVTGKVWDSVKDAAIELGFNRSTLASKLNGSKKNKTTLIYKL